MNKDTGRFAFLRQLQSDGIGCMFGNPGTSEQNLLDALSDPEFDSLKYYLALQEGSAVAMGDSYARALQRPAIVQLHSYAGLANGLGMMQYAKRGYTPMVVFAGESGLKYEALDGQMSSDLVNIARPFVKSDYNGPCAWRIVDPDSVLRLLRRALKTAATPPMGPVFLSVPMDVLDLPNHEDIVPSLPVRSHVVPDDVTIQAAAELLASGQHPLILVGDGIAASRAQTELIEVAELLGAQVYGVNNSEINIPMSHPLFAGDTGHMFGQSSLRITSSADVVLVIGTTLMPEVFPETGNIFRPGAKVVHFDLNTYEVGKNFPLTIGALADPKPTLALLAQRLRPLVSDRREAVKEVIATARLAKEERRTAAQNRDVENFQEVPLHSPAFMKALAERLQQSGRPFSIFDEALTHSPEITRYLTCDEPGTYFQTRAGMLGTGLPGAIGLKIAYPERLVVGFIGDGGSMQTIQALATAARHGIGAKFVVCNNRSYRILKYNLQQYRDERGIPASNTFPVSFDSVPPELDFERLAVGQGVAAVTVREPGQIQKALDLALADRDQPFLINLVLSSTL